MVAATCKWARRSDWGQGGTEEFAQPFDAASLDLTGAALARARFLSGSVLRSALDASRQPGRRAPPPCGVLPALAVSPPRRMKRGDNQNPRKGLGKRTEITDSPGPNADRGWGARAVALPRQMAPAINRATARSAATTARTRAMTVLRLMVNRFTLLKNDSWPF